MLEIKRGKLLPKHFSVVPLYLRLLATRKSNSLRLGYLGPDFFSKYDTTDVLNKIEPLFTMCASAAACGTD